MAIDLDVIPALSCLFAWGRLKQVIHELASDDETKAYLGMVPILCELGSERPIQDDETLSCPGYYFFKLPEDCSLSLTLEPITGEQEDVDYLDDFARNVPVEFKHSLWERWIRAGFLATIASSAGRVEGEIQIMVLIANSIARLTDGFIVVKESDVFGLPLGVYSPDQLF